MPHEIKRGKEAGFEEYITKPIDTEDLVKKIIDYNKKICVVSPILETENKIFTPEQVKKLFQKNK